MNLDEFLDELDAHEQQVPIGELVRLMKRVEFGRDCIGHCVRFRDDRYARNVLRVGRGYAALILCWKPGQVSPVHDHRGSACGVRVVSGEAVETRYRHGADGKLAVAGVHRYQVGHVCGSYDADIHAIGNESAGEDLITLHVYTPPLNGYHVYDLATGEAAVCTDAETLEAQRKLGLVPA